MTKISKTRNYSKRRTNPPFDGSGNRKISAPRMHFPSGDTLTFRIERPPLLSVPSPMETPAPIGSHSTLGKSSEKTLGNGRDEVASVTSKRHSGWTSLIRQSRFRPASRVVRRTNSRRAWSPGRMATETNCKWFFPSSGRKVGASRSSKAVADSSLESFFLGLSFAGSKGDCGCCGFALA